MPNFLILVHSIYVFDIVQSFSLLKYKIIEYIIFSLSFKFLSTNTSYGIHIPLNSFNTPFSF